MVDIALKSANQLHEQFDILSGKGPQTRSPCDTVRKAVLDSIAQRLDCLEDITTYVHKFVAHAATPDSIAADCADQIKVVYGKLWSALELLWTVCQFVDRHILRTVQSTPSFIYWYDPFEHLDQPVLRPENRKELETIWGVRQQRLDSWGADCFNFATAHLQNP